jgi:hypothetical protein
VLHRQLGEAEVEDLRAACRGDPEVVGFEIAVHDALVVGSGQTLGHFAREPHRRGERQSSSLSDQPR